jgi:hypothetical protein
VRSSNGTLVSSYILHAKGRTNNSGYKNQIPIMDLTAKLSAPNKILLHQALSYSIKPSVVHVGPYTIVRILVEGAEEGGIIKIKQHIALNQDITSYSDNIGGLQNFAPLQTMWD